MAEMPKMAANQLSFLMISWEQYLWGTLSSIGGDDLESSSIVRLKRWVKGATILSSLLALVLVIVIVCLVNLNNQISELSERVDGKLDESILKPVNAAVEYPDYNFGENDHLDRLDVVEIELKRLYYHLGNDGANGD